MEDLIRCTFYSLYRGLSRISWEPDLSDPESSQRGLLSAKWIEQALQRDTHQQPIVTKSQPAGWFPDHWLGETVRLAEGPVRVADSATENQ